MEEGRRLHVLRPSRGNFYLVAQDVLTNKWLTLKVSTSSLNHTAVVCKIGYLFDTSCRAISYKKCTWIKVNIQFPKLTSKTSIQTLKNIINSKRIFNRKVFLKRKISFKNAHFLLIYIGLIKTIFLWVLTYKMFTGIKSRNKLPSKVQLYVHIKIFFLQ